MSLSHVPSPAKISLTPLHTAAAHTSLTNMPFNTGLFVKNATVAIIPKDHLQCQPQICLAAQPLPCLHPLHPCPFQSTSHPLNRPLTISLDILALVSTILFKSVKSLKRLHALFSPPPTPGGSPSLPPLCRMSSLPHLIHPQTNSSPLSMALLPPSGLEMMSIGRKSRDLKPVFQYFNRGWTKKMMDLQSVPLGMKRTRSISPTSPSPSTMVQSSSPASSSSLMMEESQGSMPEPRERRRPESLSYMPLQTIPLSNQWSCSPPGSIVAFGVTEQHMPSLRMLSMTLTTGVSLQMSTATANTTKNVHTSHRRWSSWWPTSKITRSPAPSAKNTWSPPTLWTKSNTSHFACLLGLFNQPGREGVPSNLPISPCSNNKDISI